MVSLELLTKTKCFQWHILNIDKVADYPKHTYGSKDGSNGLINSTNYNATTFKLGSIARCPIYIPKLDTVPGSKLETFDFSLNVCFSVGQV